MSDTTPRSCGECGEHMATPREMIRHEVSCGSWGDVKRVENLCSNIFSLLDRVIPQYAEFLEVGEDEVLEAIERRRGYAAPNYYQEANFPDLGDVLLIRESDDVKAELQPEKGFRCPSCNGVSKDPKVCDTGIEIGEGKDKRVCDWKSYGLFRTMGKGVRVIVAEDFLESPVVHEIFMPVALEKEGQSTAP